VDDAFLVRGFEAFGHLPRNPQRAIDVNRPTAEARGQVFAIHELHRENVRRPGVAERCSLEPVDVRDVRVIERREQARLALEPGEAIGIAGEELR
jgi:hypothetical protein